MKNLKTPSPGRGRPPSKKKREKILQAATELFTEKGFVNTNVEDIAVAAGVSKQTVYSHFGSKENLFAVAVDAKCKSSGIDEEFINMDDPPAEFLPQIARRFLKLMMSHEALRVYTVCTVSAETHPELGATFFEHGPLRTVEVLANYIVHQNQLGNLRTEDAHHAAWQFFCMLKAEAHMRLQFNLKPVKQTALESYVDSCVAMFLRAYSSKKLK
jgi:AcrR family transcriptional regulator